MSLETSINPSITKIWINSASASEDDDLAGTVVLDKYILQERLSDPSGVASLYLAVSKDSQCPSPAVTGECLSYTAHPNSNSSSSDRSHEHSSATSPDHSPAPASSCSVAPSPKPDQERSSDTSFQPSSLMVKIYRRRDAVKPDVLSRLYSFKASGIVEIIEHGLYNGFPCIVMPYFKNGSLSRKTLTYDTIRDIVLPDVASGLKFLHEKGIIDKDIKPANLTISDDGRHVHIIDFGICSAKDDQVSVLITRTGMSPEYSAPETFNNVWVEESDYYSLGLTLYELFKGHTPYSGDLTETSWRPAPPFRKSLSPRISQQIL